VGLFKHPLELCITAAVRIRRYSKLTGRYEDINDCWKIILDGGWKHLQLSGSGSTSVQQFSTWSTST